MDVYKALGELYDEKHRLDAAIAALESRLRMTGKGTGKVRSRRGRRSMDAAEREEVSKRMSRYWASRRNGSSNGSRATETGREDHQQTVQ